MIRYLLYFSSIFHLLFAYVDAEPLSGHNILPANSSEFPFVASLGRKPQSILDERTHFCSGVLITDKHVLTAEHCLKGENKSEIDVIIGDDRLRTASIRSAEYNIDSWITYRTWARKRRELIKFETNDLAIIKLTSTVNQTGIIPVNFTKLNAQQLHRTKTLIVGWSVTDELRPTHELRKVEVELLTPKHCEGTLKLITNRRIILPKNYLCSSVEPYALTDCGDSGGPLLGDNKVLLGITRSTSCPSVNWGNFSNKFLNQYKVNIHTDINYYINFIENVTQIRVRRTEEV